MRTFCLLTSMEQILIPICSLLQLYSSDMNTLKKNYIKNTQIKFEWSQSKKSRKIDKMERIINIRNMLEQTCYFSNTTFLQVFFWFCFTRLRTGIVVDVHWSIWSLLGT